MGKVESPSNWPEGLQWPVNTAWTAEKLARLLLGIDTRGVTDEKTARSVAKKLYAHNLSYSATTVPSSLRGENFNLAREKTITAGGEPLALTPKDSRKVYEGLLVILSPNVEHINGSEPAIKPDEANFLLERIRPIVDEALSQGGVVVETIEPEALATAN